MDNLQSLSKSYHPDELRSKVSNSDVNDKYPFRVQFGFRPIGDNSNVIYSSDFMNAVPALAGLKATSFVTTASRMLPKGIEPSLENITTYYLRKAADTAAIKAGVVNVAKTALGTLASVLSDAPQFADKVRTVANGAQTIAEVISDTAKELYTEG